MVINMFVEELFQAGLERLNLRAGTNQFCLEGTDVGNRLYAFALETLTRVLEQVADLPVDKGPDNSGLKLLRPNSRVARLDLRDGSVPEFGLLQICQAYQAGAQSIVQIVSVVGEAVGGIHNLRLQERPAGAEEFSNLRGLGSFAAQ